VRRLFALRGELRNNVNYMYGGLLALKYYQLYSTRRAWFVPCYIQLLKNGFNQPPAECSISFWASMFPDRRC
jgi:hypothetical protein